VTEDPPDPRMPGSRASRLGGLLARLYPRDFRAEFEAEFRGFLELQSQEERYRGGPVRRMRFWIEVLGDAVRGAARVHRDARRGRTKMTADSWIREMKLAARTLARQPGFALLAIGTLGLGIGANTAIFSVIEGTLLRPLPYPEPDRLVWLSDGHPDLAPSGIDQSFPNLLDLKAGSKLLESMAPYTYRSVNMATEERPERVLALVATSDFLDVLGTPPIMGRDLLPEDDVDGASRVAVLTYESWRSRFGGDRDIIGRTITVDAAPAEIVGVMQPGFVFRGDPELLVPLQHIGADIPRGWRNYNAVGRMAPGADLQGLRTELQGIFAGLVEAYPRPNENWHTWADPLETFIVGRNAGSLLLFGAAVGLVLLIACVNVANLLIVRADARRRDFAVRCAMGAERSALIPHFLGEGLVLSLVGGAVGLVLARLGVDALLALFGGSLTRARDIGVDGAALGFGLSTSLVVGVLVGMVPLLRTRTSHLQEHLKDGARGASVHGNRLGKSLVVAEVALAVIIVSGAGLLTNSVWNLQRVELGVKEADRVMTFQVSLPEAGYADPASVQTFWSDLVAGLDKVPGVEAAGLVNRLPLLGGTNITNLYVYGDEERAAHFVSIRSVTPRYLDAAGVPLVAGRWLDASEFADTLIRSVVINETLARQLFAGEDPVGRLIDPRWTDEGFQVVGVVGDIMGGSATRPAPPAFYFSWSADVDRDRSVLVRAAGDPWETLPAIRQVVEGLDPQLPIYQIRTMEDIAEARLDSFHVAMSLFGIFAGFALLLGAVGIYGVMSFSVSQRKRELGVRLALGASRSSVLWMVLRQGAGLTTPGVLLGLGLALASARVLGGLLYDVSPLDVRVYVAVAALLGLVSLVATYLPAYRATRVDPMTGIRSE